MGQRYALPKGTVWLCEDCVRDDLDGGFVVGSIAMDGICARCGGLAREVFYEECQDPQVAGRGPMEASTDNRLVPVVRVIWDVNC